MAGHLYIFASRRHGTLYIGVTTDLPKRIYEHRNGLVPGFTCKYRVKRLVYVETYDDVSDAIVRERRMKEWKRDWKIRRIEEENPLWQDLAVTLLGFEPLPTESSARGRPTESSRRWPGAMNRVQRRKGDRGLA
jgi:putative endonuclease